MRGILVKSHHLLSFSIHVDQKIRDLETVYFRLDRCSLKQFRSSCISNPATRCSDRDPQVDGWLVHLEPCNVPKWKFHLRHESSSEIDFSAGKAKALQHYPSLSGRGYSHQQSIQVEATRYPSESAVSERSIPMISPSTRLGPCIMSGGGWRHAPFVAWLGGGHWRDNNSQIAR